MSDSPLPEYVDARKIFIQRGCVAGFIATRRLARLTACLVEDNGEVKAEISFVVDDFGRRRITGKLEARLMVECQRCLEPLAIELRDNINLVLVPDDEAAKNLGKEFDPLINEGNKIILAELVDEQLMLCMPIVNLHQCGPCSERTSYTTGQESLEVEAGAKTITGDKKLSAQNPFAVLASLKKDKPG